MKIPLIFTALSEALTALRLKIISLTCTLSHFVTLSVNSRIYPDDTSSIDLDDLESDVAL
jgi:hypothetical protein